MRNILIDGALLAKEIEASGYKRTELSELIGKGPAYIGQAVKNCSMPEKLERLLCAILKKDPGYFVAKPPGEKPDPKQGADVVPAAIQNIHNEITSIRELLDEMMKKIVDIKAKQVSDGGYLREAVRGLEALKQDVAGITKTEAQRAADYIEHCLVNGDARAQDIMEGADARCISRAVLNQAKEALHIRVYTSGQGASKKTYWSKF